MPFSALSTKVTPHDELFAQVQTIPISKAGNGED